MFSSRRQRPRTIKVRFDQNVRRFWLTLRVSFIVSILAVGVYLLANRLDNFVTKSDFFQITRTDVYDADSDELEDAVRDLIADLGEQGPENLYLLELDRVGKEIEKLPRIKRVTLRKEYPGRLVVNVVRREAVMVTNASGLFWIDEEGVLLERATPKEVAEAQIPILTGLRGSRFAPGMKIEQERLTETLETVLFLREHDPALSSRFAEWHLTSRNELIGILRQGAEVRFGRHDPLTKLPALATALKAKPELSNHLYVDLRFDSQVVYF